MTEQEWQTADYPGDLLTYLHDESNRTDDSTSRRRLRLFACACCRRAWSLIIDDDFRRAVELSEAFADNRTVPGDLETFRLDLLRRRQRASPETLLAIGVTELVAFTAASSCINPAVTTVAGAETSMEYSRAMDAELRLQCDYLRDIFGNPFHRRTEPWPHSLSVQSMANAAYEDLSFANLPILADALEEAGCTDAEILTHCRGPGPHVRGCWVVDLILGKS
jgi:hypothetical protein